MIDQYEPVKAKLQACIAKFKSEIGYAGQIEVSAPHYRFQFLADPESESPWPCAGESGCYVFFSTKGENSGKVLYVGKGSGKKSGMGNRMWKCFGRRRRAGETLPFPEAESWVISNEHGFVAVAVPEKHWWLALSLEYFLIEWLKEAGEPLVNKRLR